MAPTNDNFVNRIALTGNSFTVTGTNVGATGEAGEPNHAGVSEDFFYGGELESVWWSWRAPTSGEYVLTTLGSNYDTTLGVYTGSAVNSLSTVASNDDIGPYFFGLASKVSFNASAGQTYQIAVDGYASSAGDITLKLAKLTRGTSGANTINGSSGNDWIEAGAGNDVINGNGGYDFLFGGTGSDRITGGSNDDYIVSDDFDDYNYEGGNDTVYGNGGNDFIYTGGGNDLVYGGDGNDNIIADDYTHRGNDTIYGNGGNNSLNAGEGDNLVYGGPQADWIYAGAGDDIIYGNGGRDIIDAGDGDNLIHGGAQADIIYTGWDDDIIYGNGGADYIDSGRGNDTIWLGAGNASVALDFGHGADVINNFQLGQTKFLLFYVISHSDLTFADSSAGARIFYNDDLMAVVSWTSASTLANNPNIFSSSYYY